MSLRKRDEKKQRKGERGKPQTEFTKYKQEKLGTMANLEANIEKKGGFGTRQEQSKLSKDDKAEIKKLRNQLQAQKTRLQAREHDENKSERVYKTLATMFSGFEASFDVIIEKLFGTKEGSEEAFTSLLKDTFSKRKRS